MFSKIKDLDRYKQDQKRFRLAIDSVEGDVKKQGQQLLIELNEAVNGFDNVMEDLVHLSGSKLDHATAQQKVYETKTALEQWVAQHVPNIHTENS